jgi:type I restriction enzyme S subunit
MWVKDKIPELRFPDFNDTWQTHRLKELGTFKNGINKGKEDFGFGYKFINLLDVFGKQTVNSKLNLSLVNASASEIRQYNLIKGDVLFIRSSVKREGVGETVVVDEDLQDTVYSGFLIRFRDNGKLDNLFKGYCFRTIPFRTRLISFSTTSANTNINQESLNQLEVVVPTIKEQQKIADFLSVVDERIRLLQEKKSALEQFKKGVMQKLLPKAGQTNPELRFKDDNGNDFPDWEIKRFAEIAEFYSGGTPSVGRKDYYGGEIPFIRSGEISTHETELFLTSKGLTNSSAKIAEKGDLLMAIYGATSGEVAISKIKGAINQAIICIRGAFNQVYVLNWLKYEKDRLLNIYLQGGQGNLSTQIVKSYELPFPSVLEQQKIANFLTEIDTSSTQVKDQIEKTQTFKKGLLQKMFV